MAVCNPVLWVFMGVNPSTAILRTLVLNLR